MNNKQMLILENTLSEKEINFNILVKSVNKAGSQQIPSVIKKYLLANGFVKCGCVYKNTAIKEEISNKEKKLKKKKERCHSFDDKLTAAYNDLKGNFRCDKYVGVYGIFIDGICVYIGESCNILKRTLQDMLAASTPDIYYSEHENTNQLYNYLNYVLKVKKRKITFRIFMRLEPPHEYYHDKMVLQNLKSKFVQMKLPIFNIAITSEDGYIEFMQTLNIKSSSELFDGENFIERRDKLSKDLREIYWYMYRENFEKEVSSMPLFSITINDDNVIEISINKKNK